METIRIRENELAYALGAGTGASYEVPPDVRKIARGAFSNNHELREVVLPDGLEEIGPRAFAGCDSLESVTIPASVERVGDRAFEGCSSLRSVRIPAFDTAVYGEKCWLRCRSLREFTIGPETARIIYFPVTDTMLVCIPDGDTDSGVALYKGCYANDRFPTGSPVSGIVYVAFAKDAVGTEYWWYSTRKEDAVEGAYYQAHHETISGHFGRLTLDTELDFRQLSQICGFCSWGMSKWCEMLKIEPDEKIKISKIFAIMDRCAPGAGRRLAFVLEHQDEDINVLAQENHMTVEMLTSRTALKGEKLTKASEWQ